jgi:transglutaminase-like putative cysteine protease
VCQDFAHYLIALCRSVGVPARYVSGYLFASDSRDSAPVADEVLVQTHAWTEIAIPGAGWWPLDPTNRMIVGGRHVKIGHGRDYDDVLPLRGLYHGPFHHELEVSVRMRRLATPQRFG